MEKCQRYEPAFLFLYSFIFTFSLRSLLSFLSRELEFRLVTVSTCHSFDYYVLQNDIIIKHKNMFKVQYLSMRYRVTIIFQLKGFDLQRLQKQNINLFFCFNNVFSIQYVIIHVYLQEKNMFMDLERKQRGYFCAIGLFY